MSQLRMPPRAANTRSLTLMALVCLLAVTVACSGGSSSTMVGGTQQASVQIKIGDAPADSVLAFEAVITKVDMQPQSGSPVTVLSTPREIELTHLSGTLEPLSLFKVPAGTYTGAAITVSKVEVTYIPKNSTTPVHKEFTLNQTVNVNFSPALVVGPGSAIVNIDFNLAASITTDANGNITAVNPTFTVTTTSVPAGGEKDEDDDHGRMDDSVGQVSAVTPASGSTLASFTITHGMNADTQTFSVDSNTKFEDGLAQFSDIKVSMMVKVDAVTQTDGSLLATKIEMLEAAEGEEAEGIVTATTGSPVTSFQVVVHDGFGSAMPTSMLGTTVTVNVGTAVFRAPLANSDDSALLSNLPFTPKFDASTLVKGQSVEADASGQPTSPTTINARKIQLRRQALSGTVGPAASGTNATFTLLLDADSAFAKLTGVTSINVYQVSKTTMKNSASTAQGSNIRVRGLLFFDGTNYQFVAATLDRR